MKNEKIYRVLDANANRAREALRVCEDITRFVLEKPPLTSIFKKIRHEITTVVLSLPTAYRAIVATRDSVTDCGRASVIVDKKKEAVEDIFIKNIKRAEEATRVLEEFAKLIDHEIAARFQKIRFTIYDIEKKTITKF